MVNITPIFTLVPVMSGGVISAANTNRDGSGTTVTIATGSTDGTRIDRVSVSAVGTTTAGMVRLYLDNGSSKYLIKEIPVTAITPTASVAAFFGEWAFGNGAPLLVLPSGFTLIASTHNAETFHVVAYGGNF